MLDPVRIYDVLAQARAKLFEWIRPVTQEQYTQKFPFGLGTLRRTVVEMALVEWLYATALRGEQTPSREDWPISEERQPTFSGIEALWTEQAPRTRAALAATNDWNGSIDRKMARGDKMVVQTITRADAATQMLMHEVHHRAQAMAMLRQLGVEAQNLDYVGFVRRVREEPISTT
ncbi:MAG: DinB family protein [Armatimonadota bacterium]